MNALKIVADYAGIFSSILTCLMLFVKPIRNKVLGITAIKEGLQSLLRAKIVDIYYGNIDKKQLKEYEYKTLCSCYAAYIALGGNSFVKKIFKEMKEEWEIVK